MCWPISGLEAIFIASCHPESFRAVTAVLVSYQLRLDYGKIGILNIPLW